MGQKGFILDALLLMIVLFGVGLGVLVLNFTFDAITTDLLTSIDSEAGIKALQAQDRLWTAVGNAFVFFMVAQFLGIIISSFVINTHPAYFVVFVVIAVFMLLLSPIISNVYETVASAPDFITTANELEGMNWILLNLPLVMLIQLFISGVVLFGKRYATGGIS